MGGLAAVLPALVLRVAAVRRRVVRPVAPVLLLPAVPAMLLCMPAVAAVAAVAVAAVLTAVVRAVVVLHVRRAHRHRVHARLLHLHACRPEDLDVARAHDLVSTRLREHAASTQRGACHVD